METSNAENIRVLKIFGLIYAQEWIKLKRTLRINNICHRSSVARCSGPCSTSCKSNHSALHSACEFHPPLDVVKILYKAYPAAVCEYDCQECSVLHIACGHGCSPEVIKFLLEQNPEAAKKKDVENRTPFLTAFKSYVAESDKELRKANQDLLEVARELYHAYPEASVNEDCSRRNALDYAIEEELHEGTVVYLQLIVRKENSLSHKLNRINVIKLDMEKFCHMKNYVLPKSQKAMAA